MSEVVYNEDLVKTVKNKYLAVNVAAKRARDINANGLPLTSANPADKKKKPVAVATQELIDGKLSFEKGEAKVPESKTPSIFTDVEEPVDGSDIFDEELLEQESHVEGVEREEGL